MLSDRCYKKRGVVGPVNTDECTPHIHLHIRHSAERDKRRGALLLRLFIRPLLFRHWII